MSTAVQIIQIIFQCTGILFMICFMFIGIWSLIIFLKMYKNQRLQTYLLEKINTNISLDNNNQETKNTLKNSDFILDNLSFNNDNVLHFDDNIK